MLFGQDRNALRASYRNAWRKLQENASMEPLEAQIAAVVREHPEYHRAVEAEQEKDYSPEAGESNPFLHMGLHLAIRDQVVTDRPVGIAAIYGEAVRQQGGDAHEVEHRVMECLVEAIWQVQRHGAAFDEQGYLACVRRTLEQR